MEFIIARPKYKAKLTKQAFQQAGLNSTELPLIDIQSHHQLDCSQLDKGDIDYIIITSTYAADWLVEYFTKHENKLRHGLLSDINIRFICVGKSTAECLHEWVEPEQIVVAKPENSEGILALDCLKQVKNRNVLLLKGEQGRALIGKVLEQKQANLAVFNVYKRVVNKSVLHSFSVEPHSFTCIIAGSMEILNLICSKCSQQALQSLHWIVASDRIAELAVKKNLNNIVVSHGASIDELVKCATQLNLKHQ